MAMAPLILMAASAAVSIVGQQQAAKSQQQQLEFQAKQQEQKAGQERAISQQQAIESRRQAALANSRVQAMTGGGSTDEGVVDLAGRIAGEGEYNALTDLYEGEQSARGREMQATANRFEGKAIRRAANYKGVSTVLSTASSMFGNYGGGGFGGGGSGALAGSGGGAGNYNFGGGY